MDASKTVEIASYFMLALSLANGCILLYLQVAAYKRHHHQSFMLLSISTFTALLSLGVLVIPRFVPSATSWYSSIIISSTVLYAAYSVFGVWGVVSPFRSYGTLRQGA
jgi:hypothetical protein